MNPPPRNTDTTRDRRPATGPPLGLPSSNPPAPPRWRIGVLAGVTGILCCVGPTVLAAVGVVSGATALSWGNTLYDGYAWWFRVAGLAVLAGLVWWSLRRQNACSVAGVRRIRTRLLGLVGIAAATYAGLYALTSWLERFA